MAKVDVNIVDKSVVWTDNSESPEVVVDQESAKISGLYYAARDVVISDNSEQPVGDTDPTSDPLLGLYYTARDVIIGDNSEQAIEDVDQLSEPISGLYYLYRDIVIGTADGTQVVSKKRGPFTGRAIVRDKIVTLNKEVAFTAFDPSEDI